MMTRPHFSRMDKQHLLLMVLALILSGCQSGLSYRARDLPPELAARPVYKAEQLDLNRLGSALSRSDAIHERDSISVAVSSGDDDETPVTTKLQVATNGTVNVPYVGVVHVAGLDQSQAEAAIQHAGIQRQIFVSPAVSVQLTKQHKNQITVVGAVKKPGQYDIRPEASTLATILLAAGGLAENANLQITVHTPQSTGNSSTSSQRNPGTPLLQAGYGRDNSTLSLPPRDVRQAKIVQINLLSQEEFQRANVSSLPDGTVITVHKQADRYITVMGLTGNRVFELPYDRDFRMLDALAAGGGPKFSPWISNKLKVLRPDPQTGEIVSIRANLGEAKRNRDSNIPLGPGDIFLVEETPLTFTLSTLGQLLGLGRQAVSAAAIP